MSGQDLKKLREDAEEVLTVMVTVLNSHELRLNDLMSKLIHARENFQSRIRQFRGELAKLKLLQVKMQLLAEIKLVPAEAQIEFGKKREALVTAEKLMVNLLAVEESLRVENDKRAAATEGLKEQLQAIKIGMVEAMKILGS